ncbi:MAG: O-antigen ligase family protein [Pseudonocardiaceae bacterium]
MTDTRAVRPVLREPTSSRHVGMVWSLLLVNTLGYTDVPMVIPFPRGVGQLVTMGALLCALGLALVLNPRLRIQPSPYLLLLTLLLVVGVAASLRLESGLGALFRCVRGALFLTTLWLLTRWWRGDLSFVRHHVRALGAVLLVVAAGLVVSPDTALPELYGGRLVGTLWPIPPPQVGQYAAVAAGLTILLWLTRQIDGRSAAWIVPSAVAILLLSHTRTALLALVAGVLGALLNLTLSSARARRAVIAIAVLGGLIAVTLGPAVQHWLARGQDTDQLANLTGRQNVWEALLAQPRTLSEQLLGVGLTNKSFNGLPIDSGWLAIYYDQGLVGVAIGATFMVWLLATAMLRPPSPARACAIFLILYCAIASYAEVGLGDASPYLLHLAVAAALLTRVPG